MRTKQSQRLTLVQGGAGVEESGCASTTCGCESHALITLPPTNKEAQLSELLNDLERKILDLEYRYLEVCAILTTDMARLAELNLFKIDTDITE